MAEAVFEAGGLLRASSAAALERYLARRAGIQRVDANPVAQEVTVAYDEAIFDADAVRALIAGFGCQCGGELVACHLCAGEQPAVLGSALPHGAAPHASAVAPAQSPSAAPGDQSAHAVRVEVDTKQTGHDAAALATPAAPSAAHAEHAEHAMPRPAATTASATEGEMAQMAHAMAMGHGSAMSMADMVRDMRNRFLVALLLAIPVFLYSPLATQVFNVRLATPFGVDPKLLMFILSTPAVLWSGQIFLRGRLPRAAPPDPRYVGSGGAVGRQRLPVQRCGHLPV